MKNILTAVLKSISVHGSHIRVMRQVLSFFLYSSNNSEIRNDNSEARATASAAAKVSEDMSVIDAEILRLIEERRHTHPREKSIN